MILTLSTYQKGMLKLPNSVIAPNGADNTVEIQDFIDTYEREILIKGLGNSIYEELKSSYIGDPLTLDVNAPQRIKDLVNGLTYTVDGLTVRWEGMALKTSFLAYYVYYKYMQGMDGTLSTFGVERPEGNNSEAISAIPKATRAYRSFFEKYQGNIDGQPRRVFFSGGSGLDYYGNRSTDRSLYQFLSDRVEYSDAEFMFLENLNSFGL